MESKSATYPPEVELTSEMIEVIDSISYWADLKTSELLDTKIQRANDQRLEEQAAIDRLGQGIDN